MIIISHRGAAGLAPENTLEGIEAAKSAEVDAVEIDVQLTKDKKLVLLHDQSLYRLTGRAVNVGDLTLKEINTTSTHSGHPIPTLEEALEHIGKTPVYLDCKGKGWPKVLAKTLEKHNTSDIAVGCVNQKELFEFAQLMPPVKTYLSDMTKPLSALYAAHTLKFTGVTLNFWTLNLLSYHYAMRSGLKVLVYTLNRPLLARFVHFLYPRAQIITDYPDRLAALSSKRRQTFK